MPPAEPFTVAAARGLGLTRGQLRRPEYVRLAHGVVVRLDDALDEEDRLRLLATVLPADAAFSHRTAAALLGAPVDPPARPHLALTPRRVLPQHTGLVVHGRRLGPADVVVHHGLRLTSGAQTFLDLAAVLPAAELAAVGDALWRERHLDPMRLGERLRRADRVRGVVRARQVAPLLSPLAQSRPESLIRWWLTASDLPTPRPQVEVHDGTGLVVAHGDLGYSDWKVLLEYEGRHHAEAEQFGRDIHRYSLMAADGWLVLRFATQHLGSPWTVVARTRAALVSRGWRPAPR
ncbi:hypothetical protein [Modestobacter marinus]|uniref:hypothetical protein n=1 Tax=Modestobacter marinus TaxID=477641 RepID=UPI001C946574|nr:hypothetical protein [Modestobacter marinus]